MKNGPTMIKQLLLFAILVMLSSSCSRADNLIGLWRTDLVKWDNPTGHTNEVNGYYTLEFFQDGYFKFGSWLKAPAGKDLPMPWVFNGKFHVIDAKHIRMEISKSKLSPTGGAPVTNLYTLSGDKLQFLGLPKN